GRGVSETAEALGIWRKTAGHRRRRWLAAEASAGVGRAVERRATMWGAGNLHAGADLPDHGAGLRRPRAARCSDQPVEPERTGPSGSEPGHRQEYLARLRRALFKKVADLKPHRSRYWLTPKPDPEFDAKCADICTVYQAAPAAVEQDVHTVSIDEMTGIQALERAAPTLPMKPGHVERREFEYVGMAPSA